MSSTIKAARACASTLLFHSLRLHAFRGAAPHVLIVVDKEPCVQQKVLVEGYLQVLHAYQLRGSEYLANNHDTVMETSTNADENAHHRSHNGDLFISLALGAKTPCGSAGFTSRDTSTSIAQGSLDPLSYSLLPFDSESFLDVVKRLQVLLRHCGDGRPVPSRDVRKELTGVNDREANGAQEAAAITETLQNNTSAVWSAAAFKEAYEALSPLLDPLMGSGGRTAAETANVKQSTAQPLWRSLFDGPKRELLGCILVQQNAFQNEMKRYRLRLSLFDLGVRVVEHCHLSIMSQEADRLAGEGRYREAIEDDQVYSYARSCAFPPEQALCLAKAIADAIDLHSWKRVGHGEADAPTGQRMSPSSITDALLNKELQTIFKPGAIEWYPSSGCAGEVTVVDVASALQRPIEGPGEPLSIVCRDPSKVLTFSGGMEDCLMNTGYYVAAFAAERNDVTMHRERFQSALTAEEIDEVGETSAVAVHGRMKKKDYLAMLRSKGQRPNKPHHDSVEDEDGAESRSAPAGSCISNSIGGTFPIGEVISESFDLSQLNGTCDIFAYPDVYKRVTLSHPVPFTITIEKGVVTRISDGAPAEFLDLLSLVRQVEGNCYVRELGIGLNPYVGPAHVVNDVTTFERQWGIHLSLGQRHPLFVKQRERLNVDGTVAAGVTIEGPVLKRKAGKYHIDVFVDAAQLRMGDVFCVDFTKGIAIP